MKRCKLLVGLLLSNLVLLSGCALFNDDDMKYENKFNPATVTPEEEPEDPDAPKAQGVTGKEVAEVPNAYCFKNVGYAVDGKIPNTYKNGGVNHLEYNINDGKDYDGTRSANNYDLYVPNSASKSDKHLVILFIHGGAWVSGLKTQVNEYVHEFANKGYITATIKYTLLKRAMDDPTLSIFRDLDEIDACITSIKGALEDLEFDTTKTKFAIGGVSSGAHLSMLYAYSRGQRSALPINFVIDAVGPVNIKPDNWKKFKNSTVGKEAGLTYTAITAQLANLDELSIADVPDAPVKYWNDYQTMRIANGMCGLPFSLEQVRESTNEDEEFITNPNAASTSMLKADGGEDQLSVTYWIDKGVNNYPIICAYAGSDSIVGIAQYAALEHALDNAGITKEYVYFKECNHQEITKEKDEEHYTELINKISEYCVNALA